MSDIIERLRDWVSNSTGCNPANAPCAEAADEIERLREALERVSTSNNLPFIWEVSKTALNSSANLTSSVVKDCLTTDCATRRQIIDERDRTFALMLARAKNAERQLKALLRWTDALAITGSVTVEAWRELDKIATKAHKVLAGEK